MEIFFAREFLRKIRLLMKIARFQIFLFFFVKTKCHAEQKCKQRFERCHLTRILYLLFEIEIEVLSVEN